MADGDTTNDQFTDTFTIALTPLPLPVFEGFEGSTSLPAGWSVWIPRVVPPGKQLLPWLMPAPTA